MKNLLLDTCAAIWLTEDEFMSENAVSSINQAAKAGGLVFVSPMTAWEIGLLAARDRIAISITPQAWFARLLAVPGIVLAELSPNTLISSSFLPGAAPRDPADRIIAATARDMNLRLVTRDAMLLDYAAQGHLDALAC